MFLKKTKKHLEMCIKGHCFIAKAIASPLLIALIIQAGPVVLFQGSTGGHV
jgi:hypothetical protein